jgi:hypothetical protein
MDIKQRAALVRDLRLEVKQDTRQRGGSSFARQVERDIGDETRMREGGGINRYRGGVAAIGRLSHRYRQQVGPTRNAFRGRAGFANRQRRGFSNGYGL